MKIVVDHIKNGKNVQTTLDVPDDVFNQCSFDHNGAIVGTDYVEEYLRIVHNIWCEDWIVPDDNWKSSSDVKIDFSKTVRTIIYLDALISGHIRSIPDEDSEMIKLIQRFIGDDLIA